MRADVDYTVSVQVKRKVGRPRKIRPENTVESSLRDVGGNRHVIASDLNY